MMDISGTVDRFQFDKVADLSKEEFSRLMDACFEEFLKSNEIRDVAFHCAEQVVRSRR